MLAHRLLAWQYTMTLPLLCVVLWLFLNWIFVEYCKSCVIWIPTLYTAKEYAYKHPNYGKCRCNVSEVARLYHERCHNSCHPNYRVFVNLRHTRRVNYLVHPKVANDVIRTKMTFSYLMLKMMQVPQSVRSIMSWCTKNYCTLYTTKHEYQPDHKAWHEIIPDKLNFVTLCFRRINKIHKS